MVTSRRVLAKKRPTTVISNRSRFIAANRVAQTQQSNDQQSATLYSQDEMSIELCLRKFGVVHDSHSSHVENKKKKKKKSLILLRFYNKCLKIEKHDLTIYFFHLIYL